MTVADNALARLIATKRVLLLDFDGPICSIFAGLPARAVAERLRMIMTAEGFRITPDIAATEDPLMILRLTDELGDCSLSRTIEGALAAAELEAAETAVPTPGGHEIIRAATGSGWHVGVVSNNSEVAVRSYLVRHSLYASIGALAARYDGMSPALMKPDKHLVLRALRSLGSAPSDAVLIGDSTADVGAAQAAQVASIGFANLPHKTEALRECGAEIVVNRLTELLVYFRRQCRSGRT